MAAAAAALVITAVACAFVPLADHLGFELAMVLGVVAALVMPMVGVAAARLDRDRPENDRSPVRAAVESVVVAVALVGLPVVIILGNGLRRPVCEPLDGLGWVLLLALPSAMLGAATGAFARTRTGSAPRAAAYVVTVEAASLWVSLREIYAGPQFFFTDHFFGHYPGPIYDEVVRVTWPLVAFRIMTLGWAAAAVAACGLAADDPWSRRRASLVAGGLALALGATSLLFGTDLRLRTTDASLRADLGGQREVDGVTVRFPREWAKDDVDRLVMDVRFRAAQVRAELKVSSDAKATVWMYRSAAEKQRLAGAGATSFAKPWRHEIHIHPQGQPHTSLRHELVHAFGGYLAGGPFHVPGGLFPNTPLLEGFAVALDVETDGATLEELARAMRDLKLAPDVSALLSAQGFLTAAPARAYGYAGAFLRFIDRRDGRDALLRLYRDGDLSTLGDPAAVTKAFDDSLTALALPDAVRATAARRFQRRSAFSRPCARESSGALARARELMTSGHQDAGIAAFEEACRLDAEDPAPLRALLDAARESGDATREAEASARLEAHPGVSDAQKSAILTQRGDRLLKTGDLAAAARAFDGAANFDIEPSSRRALFVRRACVQAPELLPVLVPLVVDGKTDVATLFALRDWVDSHPDDALVRYLLARQLLQQGGPARAMELLAVAQAHGLGDPELDREAARLLVRAAAEAGKCDDAAAFVAGVTQSGADAADTVVAKDQVARCRFEAAQRR